MSYCVTKIITEVTSIGVISTSWFSSQVQMLSSKSRCCSPNLLQIQMMSSKTKYFPPITDTCFQVKVLSFKSRCFPSSADVFLQVQMLSFKCRCCPPVSESLNESLSDIAYPELHTFTVDELGFGTLWNIFTF